VVSSDNLQELAETFKNVAKLATCSRDNVLSLLPSGHRSKGGLASASPPLHSKRTVQHIFERKQLIGTLYRRGSQAVNHFKASIILYVLQFIVVVFD
jgi:hypothetical protein